MCTISEFIEDLEEFKKQHGDIDVFVPFNGNDEKLTIPNIKHSSKLKQTVSSFELEPHCRCCSCFDWFEFNKEEKPFILIDVDWV